MMYNPAHPGEIIQEYMEGLDLTVSSLAAHLRITRANLSRMIHGKTGVSAGMALRLSDAFGTSPQVWIRMQANFDLAKAAHESRRKSTDLHCGRTLYLRCTYRRPITNRKSARVKNSA